MLSTGSVDLFEFYPLPNDPTIEERERLNNEAISERKKTNEEYERSVLADYKKRGFT